MITFSPTQQAPIEHYLAKVNGEAAKKCTPF
jgi:hypothetical protein